MPEIDPFWQNDFTCIGAMDELSELQKTYQFDLPDELIARHPAQFRDQSRLMVLPADRPLPENRSFFELDQILEPSDILVWNDTLVEPRRVFLQRSTGARIEALFLEPVQSDPSRSVAPAPEGSQSWSCLIRNASRIKQEELLIEPQSQRNFRFLRLTDSANNHSFFLQPEPGLNMHEFFLNYGQMPIPPYLGREEEAGDRNRYQTVYAGDQDLTSAAAPTAGLHFSAPLIDRLKDRGIRIASVRLAVGLGTFAPLTGENLRKGELHEERFSMPETTATLLNHPAGRIIAVGTTTLRALESNLREYQRFEPGTFQTRAFFKPPDRIRSIQGLITNFHLPGSSLLMLVSAFAGTERILHAYRQAVEDRYRFYSYGDAMLVFA
ncbi:MAG: tRNA preQ1(34) S-adenosylmethionine ribosyltransferase-isomerase QueA [Spirochaetaceae bacterium]|nr:tRNA preQ1(34) S-adenosylmethionine ribosyltransferase-isomerase QueA [Spirochaetaceae bacterium]